MSTMKIPDSYKKNAPPNSKKKTAADYGWPDKWKPITQATYELIRQSRPDSYMPKLESLIAYGFRETTWWKGPKQRTLIAYPVGAHLKIAFADIRETDKKSYPKRFWWTTEDFPQDQLVGWEPIAASLTKYAEHKLDVFIPEGQWDSIALVELKYPSLALLNNSQRHVSPEIVSTLKDKAGHVFLIPDNDGDPKSLAAAEAVKNQLSEAGIPVAIIELPGTIKDVCAFLKRFGADALRQYIGWIADAAKHGCTLSFPNKRSSAPETKDQDSNASSPFVLAAVVECTRADQIEPEPKEWLWQDRMPLKKLTVFFGLPDTGKSTVSIDVAARVTRGWDFPDRKNTHRATCSC